jgi:hypothetical protein
VYHGLSGTERERLILKGFLHCGTVHEFIENRTHIPSLAIPAEVPQQPISAGYFGKSAYPCSLYRNDFIRHWQITADAADRGAGADLEFVRALNAGLE